MQKIIRIIAAVAGIAVTAQLYGCGNAGRSGEIGPTVVEVFDSQKDIRNEKTIIRVVSFCVGDDPFRPAWQTALKIFQERNPGIEIVDESTPALNDAFRTKVKTDFASGNEPDFTWFYNGTDAAPLIQSGKLFEFDKEILSDREWSSSFRKEALEAGKQNGKTYSISVLGFFEALFCNKDLFDKFGLEIPDSYQKFDRAIDVFKSKKITPIAASIDDSYYLLEYFVLSTGGREGHSSEFRSSIPPSWVAALNKMKYYFDKGAFPKDALTISDDTAREMFYSKKAAMMINGSWCLGQLQDQENTVITYFPVVKGGKASYKDIIGGYGTGFYLSRDMNEKKNGMPLKLLKFMSSPEIVKKLSEKAIIVGLDINTENSQPLSKESIDFYNGASSVNFPFGDRIEKEAFTNIRKKLAYVVHGKMSAEELLQESLRLVKK